MEKQKSALLIYNPRSGKNSKRPDPLQVLQALSIIPYNITLKQTAYSGHAAELAEEYGGNFDLVICCGGDGTLSETAGGLLKGGHQTKLGYIPMGSTNDLAGTIGIPSDLNEAAKIIKEGHTNGYDVGSFNDRFFNYIALFGPGASVSYGTPQKMKNALGYNAYMINAFLLNIIPTLKQVKPKHIKIEYDGQVMEDDFYFGAVSNALTAGGMFHFDPKQVRLNDGKFEILLVRKIKHSTDLFKMLHRIQKRDYDGETLLFLQASDIHFTFSQSDEWTLDGEYSGKLSDVHFKVVPKGVQIVSPKNELFLND